VEHDESRQISAIMTLRSASFRSGTTGTSSSLRDRYTDDETQSVDARALVPIITSPTPTSTVRRTLEDVRSQVAHEVAVRAITKSELLDDSECPRT
jgi:hypothetical protein